MFSFLPRLFNIGADLVQMSGLWIAISRVTSSLGMASQMATRRVLESASCPRGQAVRYASWLERIESCCAQIPSELYLIDVT